MNRVLIISFIILGCKSSNNSEVQKRKVEIKSLVTNNSLPDSTELKKAWQTSVMPIINLDKNQLKQIVIFPLEGNWGNMINLNKPQSEWTEEDFYTNLNKLFYPEFIDSLKIQTYNNFDFYNNDNGPTNLVINVYFVKYHEDFKAESAITLRFKKIDNLWKLHAIFAAG